MIDWILLIKVLILGIVEGLTEFLPISSTGHLIVVGNLIGFDPPYEKTFDVVIQLGAILAVCWEYRQRIIGVCMGLGKQRSARVLASNIIIATIPAVFLALLFEKIIKFYLFNPVSVACALFLGGCVILWVERKRKLSHVKEAEMCVEDLSLKQAFKVGLMQCFALIPGVSRSGATIIGGMLLGLPRRVATEFSFFLAIPIIFGATIYELYHTHEHFSAEMLSLFSIGGIAAFISAFLCVRWLLRYISHHDFTVFAWYRIAFALGIFVLYTLGYLHF